MLPAQTEKNCTQCGAIYSDDIEVCSVDGAALVPKYLLELVGTRFDGRYRILSLLGYCNAAPDEYSGPSRSLTAAERRSLTVFVRNDD